MFSKKIHISYNFLYLAGVFTNVVHRNAKNGVNGLRFHSNN
jgi:hypothetical protein